MRTKIEIERPNIYLTHKNEYVLGEKLSLDYTFKI